jgi:hypothetical protein
MWLAALAWAALLYIGHWHMDDGWSRVWSEMTDQELEEALFRYLWLAHHTPNAHAGRVAQLIAEAERRERSEMIERARAKAATTPVARLILHKSRLPDR